MVDGGLKMLLNGCRCALDRAARFGNLRARMGAWPHIWIEVGIKMKRRPKAAEVETTAEDIESSNISGSTEDRSPAEAIVFAFYSPLRIVPSGRRLVKSRKKALRRSCKTFHFIYLKNQVVNGS